MGEDRKFLVVLLERAYNKAMPADYRPTDDSPMPNVANL